MTTASISVGATPIDWRLVGNRPMPGAFGRARARIDQRQFVSPAHQERSNRKYEGIDAGRFTGDVEQTTDLPAIESLDAGDIRVERAIPDRSDLDLTDLERDPQAP